MKIGNRKLTLTRETLQPLQDAELGGINGGTTPATPGIYVASARFCIQSAVATQKISATHCDEIAHSVAKGTKAIGHGAKKLWHKVF